VPRCRHVSPRASVSLGFDRLLSPPAGGQLSLSETSSGAICPYKAQKQGMTKITDSLQFDEGVGVHACGITDGRRTFGRNKAR
jgi:hypothetical protein